MKQEFIVAAAANPEFPAARSWPLTPATVLAQLARSGASLRAAVEPDRFDRLFSALDRYLATTTRMVADAMAADESLDVQQAAVMEALADVEAQLVAMEPGARPGGMPVEEWMPALAVLRADLADLQRTFAATARADHAPLEEQLIAAGFADPISGARRLRDWRTGIPPVMRSAAERRSFRELMPQLIETVALLPDPDSALCAMDELLTRLPPEIILFGALEARPSLMQSLLGLLGHVPALSRFLIAQPGLVRRLIDTSAYAPLPPLLDIEHELAVALAGADKSAAAVRLAHIVNGYRFGLGLQLFEGIGDPADLATDAALVAEAALRMTAQTIIDRFVDVHGRIAGSELVILGLGRFGGGALTCRSDLDLIYLFTGDHRESSDGAKPLDANEYYSRIAQRITRAMTTATSLGPLYEIDTRLRPWGPKGLLACSTSCFGRYHAESAWTWEHMALTRARPVFGSDRARREVTDIVGQRLRERRNRGSLLADALKMRGDIARHKPARGPFDIKRVDGGLVDLEFTVHVNQLGHHIGLHPRLRAAIRSLVAAGLLDPAIIAAHDMLSRMLVVFELLSPNPLAPAPEIREAIAAACRQPSWDALVDAYDHARRTVRQAWKRTVVTAFG
jgi:glutamate-ammonia-ligase adenylyltransferase